MWAKTHSYSVCSSPSSEKDQGLSSLFRSGICPLLCFFLIKQPSEPIAEIFLQLLTLETVFLTLLVSGARSGALHAIAYSTLTQAPNWTNSVLRPIPGFISKTQLRTKGASSLEPIVIPSLGHTLGHDLAKDRHLCSVRCLKVYLLETKPFREGKSLLFISLQKNKASDISKNTISGWVRSLLHTVHSNANKDAAALVSRTTHAIRAMAASLAFSSQIDLDEILVIVHGRTTPLCLNFTSRI